jgi:hypothetical protein
MTRALLTRRLWGTILAAVLFCVVSVGTVRADPIRITSGEFLLPDDDPSFFHFAGTDGFVLGGLFIPTAISPYRTCIENPCTPGTIVNLSATAGGDLVAGSLGLATGGIVHGTSFGSLQLRGTFQFDAPVVQLTAAGFVKAPFDFNGQVTGFARDDVELIGPLFAVDLFGHGTVVLSGFPDPVDVSATYTFAADAPPTPEPATVILFGTGLAGLAARASTRKRIG